MLRALHASKVPMCYTVAGPHETLRGPWGWLCIETVLGTTPVTGYRWGCYSDVMTPGFAELGFMMLPSNRGSIKVNSTLALVSKMFMAFEELKEGGMVTSTAIEKCVKAKQEGASSVAAGKVTQEVAKPKPRPAGQKQKKARVGGV